MTPKATAAAPRPKAAYPSVSSSDEEVEEDVVLTSVIFSPPSAANCSAKVGGCDIF